MNRRIRELTSGRLTMTVRPERGAKIESLRDAQGREWLAQTARVGTSSGLSFGAAEMAGWDECAPTIDACTVDGRALPDHGDAWDVAWSDAPDSSDGTLIMAGTSWPYTLRRTASATSRGGIRLTYVARSTADHAIPFLWAAHPQLVAEPGARIEIDPAPASLVDVLHPDWPEVPWTPDLMRLDDLDTGGCSKLYVHPSARVRSATLIQPDGARLQLEWSKECRYLGLWFDNGCYADAPVVAIEPAIAYADSLAVAARLGTCPILEPGASLTWWVEVTTGPGRPSPAQSALEPRTIAAT